VHLAGGALSGRLSSKGRRGRETAAEGVNVRNTLSDTLLCIRGIEDMIKERMRFSGFL